MSFRHSAKQTQNKKQNKTKIRKTARLWHSSSYIWDIIVKRVSGSPHPSNNKGLCGGVFGLLHSEQIDREFPPHITASFYRAVKKALLCLALLPVCAYRCSMFLFGLLSSFLSVPILRYYFSFPTKLLNSSYTENLAMGKLKFIYIASSSGSNRDI